jgi:hypothetical protein
LQEINSSETISYVKLGALGNYLPDYLFFHDTNGSRFRENPVLDQNFRTWFQGRDEILENLSCILIGLVMKDPAKVIDVCRDSLGSEEIMSGQADAAF